MPTPLPKPTKAQSRYARYLAAGRCVDCGKHHQDKTSRCEVCLKRERERVNALRLNRKVNGLCPHCGIPSPDTVYCPKCITYVQNWAAQNLKTKRSHRRKTREYNERYRARLRAEGKCVRCGKPRFEAKAVCDDCSRRSVQRQRENVENYGVRNKSELFTTALSECVFNALSRLEPKQSHVIHREVEEDYGKCSKRQVIRVLRELVTKNVACQDARFGYTKKVGR